MTDKFIDVAQVRREFENHASQGLNIFATEVLSEAVDRVPLDTGDLSRSGAVHQRQGALEAWVVFDSPYAIRQHEDLTLEHKNGREAKYLENAAKELRPTMETMIGNYVKGKMS